jgi:sporulation protein YlmC with PRC-barrel domain
MDRKSENRRAIELGDVRGKPVLRRETGEKLGDVADVLIDPSSGNVLGLEIKGPDGQLLGMDARNVLIGRDAVMASAVEGFDPAESGERLRSAARASHDLAGTSVVTEDGTFLGRVGGIFISLEQPRVFYRVVESTIQRFLGGGGFYLPGDVLRAYSPDGPRMIVPSDVDRFAAGSLDELLGAEVHQ